MKSAIILSLGLLLSFATAAERVKAKQGSIDLGKNRDGSQIICSAGFSEELSMLDKQGDFALVKGSCGQGWVAIQKLEKVMQGPGDKSITTGPVDIIAPIDNPYLTEVNWGTQDLSNDGVNIDRNFKEYLRQTIDKEDTERRNMEN